MRTQKDRLRHTILFELIALLIAVPLFSSVSGHGVGETGILAIGLSMIAMAWNYGFNLMFDQALASKGMDRGHRTLGVRVIHAALFELGLLIIMLPIVAWWLQLSLLDALLMDVGFALFFMAYAFVFNWVYDWVFPVEKAEVI